MVFSPFSRLISSAASSASQRPFFSHVLTPRAEALRLCLLVGEHTSAWKLTLRQQEQNKATTSGSVIIDTTIQATTQASATSASSASLRPFFALLAITCISYRYQNYVVRGLISQYLLATSRGTTPI